MDLLSNDFDRRKPRGKIGDVRSWADNGKCVDWDGTSEIESVLYHAFIEVHDGFRRKAGGKPGFYVSNASGFGHYDQSTLTRR